MNFLAHCLIAARAGALQPAPEAIGGLVAGGFLGDFLKGPVAASLPADLAAGVRLHRRIDAYSNGHEVIRRSCNRFPAQLRRLAPVFVDIIADHVLATEWGRHHDVPLPAFTHETYAHIAAIEGELPPHGQRFFRYMADTDLLARYESWEVAHEALRSITRRLDRQSLDPLLEEHVPGLLEALREDFSSYFPDLCAHARDWLSAAR